MDLGIFLYFYAAPVLGIIICILNAIETLFLVKKYRIKNPYQKQFAASLVLLINLAASDFFVGVTVVLVNVFHKLLERRLVHFLVYRATKFLFLRLSLLTSVFNLLALTVDRVLVICYPIQHRQIIKRKRLFLVILAIWFLSFVFVSLHYYISFYTEVRSFIREYEKVIFPATIFPATIIFCACYVKIVRAIRVQGEEILKFGNQYGGTTENRRHRTSSHIVEREIKITKLAATVVMVFLICWIPVGFIGLACFLGLHGGPSYVNTTFFLAFCNSAVDPLIYFGFKKKVGRKISDFSQNNKLKKKLIPMIKKQLKS